MGTKLLGLGIWRGSGALKGLNTPWGAIKNAPQPEELYFVLLCTHPDPPAFDFRTRLRLRLVVVRFGSDTSFIGILPVVHYAGVHYHYDVQAYRRFASTFLNFLLRRSTRKKRKPGHTPKKVKTKNKVGAL